MASTIQQSLPHGITVYDPKHPEAESIAAEHAATVETLHHAANFRVVPPESPWADAASSAVLSLAALRAGRRQGLTQRPDFRFSWRGSENV